MKIYMKENKLKVKQMEIMNKELQIKFYKMNALINYINRLNFSGKLDFLALLWYIKYA